LIRRIDDAVRESSPERCTRGVKAVLEDVVSRGSGFLPEPLVAPVPDHYARRLLHLDPDGRFSIVIMTWGAGQSTPVHDHAGLWCVECVYEGVIEVTSYALTGDPRADRVRLEPESSIRAGVGEAGALIPPFEYHRIANPGADNAVTIHVYGGEMAWCNRFEPDGDGTWSRKRCELSFD
jgi:predicted metal-dependent enzyme (double-stranded beta helix superfamily)